jgi:DNA (cytosine-5)-methyltransferase 1
MPTVLDLFSGCGGFSLGAHQAGFSTALAVDIDTILSGSFLANFPKSRLLHRDIRELDQTVLKELLPQSVDGVIGGPPCQGFSEIGRRDPADPRRELVGDFFRVVKSVRPSFFVFENVRGLSFPENIGILETEIKNLPNRWKLIGPVVLNASDFGAPTKRKRLFVFGFDTEKMTVPDANELIKPSTLVPVTVREAIFDLSSASACGENAGGFDVWKYDLRRSVSGYAGGMRSKQNQFTGHRKTQHTNATLTRFANVKPGSSDKVGKYQRLHWAGQCPTLRAGTGSDRGSYQAVRPLHPLEDRVITPREAARLQGFHDAFLFHPTVWHSFRMIGNSVSPIMAKVLMSRIGRALKVQQKPS